MLTQVFEPGFDAKEFNKMIGMLGMFKYTPSVSTIPATTFAEFANSSLKREHVVAVAMSVYGGIKKAISRKGALDYIRKPHDAYMSAKRGIDATGGRSAA